MGYNTANTEWPEIPLPDPVKSLIDRFFSLMDNDGKDVGDQLADEIFTSDGRSVTAHNATEGTDQIRKSRENAWTVIKSRRHEVLKAYVDDSKGSDLLLLCNVAMKLGNGKGVGGEFIARMVVSGATTSQPKLKLYQIWADSAPLTQALKDN